MIALAAKEIGDYLKTFLPGRQTTVRLPERSWKIRAITASTRRIWINPPSV